ncbi:hypothetical protein [Longitalea luteola]|nr:hypothetical protein [Longitalea luteola]
MPGSSARTIVTYLQQRHPVPDFELLLSQLDAAEPDSSYSALLKALN